MFKKGIARRWLFNSLGVMILLFTACIAALSFVVQSYAYNGIQMTLIGRSDELPTVLSGSMKTVSEFNAAARSYTENFPDKDLMEVMAVSRSGSILSTSSGFAPDQNQSKPDFESALHSENGYGYWIGKLASGEKIMAVSRVARGANGAVHRLYGARRPADYVCRAGFDRYRRAYFGARHAFGHLFCAVYYHAHSGTQCYGGKNCKGRF